MQLTHGRTLMEAEQAPNKVQATAWSPNCLRLAAATRSRVVHLFDEHGDRRDKFSTKPADSHVRAGAPAPAPAHGPARAPVVARSRGIPSSSSGFERGRPEGSGPRGLRRAGPAASGPADPAVDRPGTVWCRPSPPPAPGPPPGPAEAPAGASGRFD